MRRVGLRPSACVDDNSPRVIEARITGVQTFGICAVEAAANNMNDGREYFADAPGRSPRTGYKTRAIVASFMSGIQPVVAQSSFV